MAATNLIIPSQHIYIAGAVLAAPVLLFYLLTRRRFNAKIDLEESTRIIVGCVGIPAGLKIMYYSIFATDLKELDRDRLVVLVGGYVVTFIAVRGIFRVLKP